MMLPVVMRIISPVTGGSRKPMMSAKRNSPTQGLPTRWIKTMELQALRLLPRRSRILPWLLVSLVLLSACAIPETPPVETPCPVDPEPPVALQVDPPMPTAQTAVKPFLQKASTWARKVESYFAERRMTTTVPPSMPPQVTPGR